MNVLLLLVIAVTVGAVVFGVMTLVSGGDPGLRQVEPDSRARPLPGDRPLTEGDVSAVTFDLAWRGYRMGQVDRILRRMAYDIGYKSELINVLEAEIAALRDGRLDDADTFASARVAALRGAVAPAQLSHETVTEVAAVEPDRGGDSDSGDGRRDTAEAADTGDAEADAGTDADITVTADGPASSAAKQVS